MKLNKKFYKITNKSIIQSKNELFFDFPEIFDNNIIIIGITASRFSYRHDTDNIKQSIFEGFNSILSEFVNKNKNTPINAISILPTCISHQCLNYL